MAGADRVYQEFTNRFRAEEIVNIMYQVYFQGKDNHRAKVCFDMINGAFVCFVAAAI